MSRQLPRELVESVIDKIANNTQALISFSLTNTTFTPQCQKYIFRAVRLWPYGIQAIDGSPSPETIQYNERSLLLARTVIQNPSLGSYVQHLDYQVTSVPHAESGDLDDILRAIELMPNIVELYLGSRMPGFLPISGVYPVSVLSLKGLSGSNNPAAARWRRAMLSLLRRPTLRTLTLMRVRSLSIDSLSTGIQSLHLRNTGLTFDSVRVPSTSPASQTRLKRLSCDPVSMYNYHVGAAKPDPSDRLDLSGVENLRIEFQYLSQEYIMKHLLNETTCLRELEFSINRKINTGDMPDSHPVSPLEYIHPASFNTLSHLKIGINVMLRRSTTFLQDPYAHMADNALANLVALRTLESNFVLPSHLSLQHSRHLCWDQLPTTLARPGALPKLRRVAIHIIIRRRTFATEIRNSGYSERGAVILPQTEEEAADRLAEDLTELVYKSQFLPLLTLRPELDLSFTTQVVLPTSLVI